jgi:hypothetical protein
MWDRVGCWIDRNPELCIWSATTYCVPERTRLPEKISRHQLWLFKIIFTAMMNTKSSRTTNLLRVMTDTIANKDSDLTRGLGNGLMKYFVTCIADELRVHIEA